jgi:hypothetical protein
LIEVSHHIRKAYFDLLEGNVTYNSITVPVYDELNEDYEGLMYIVLGTQNDNDSSNKHSFTSDHVITIDIVTRFITSARKLPSEDISGQIKNLVLPTPSTCGLISPSGLQITAVKKLDDISIPVEQFDTWKVVRKILRYTHKCVQI